MSEAAAERTTAYAVIVVWGEGGHRGMTQVSSWWNTPEEAIKCAERRNTDEDGNEYRAVSTDRFGYFRALVPGESLYVEAVPA